MKDPDVRPLAHPRREQPAREPRRSPLGFRVGQHVVVAGEKDRRSARLDSSAQQRGDGQRKPVTGIDPRRNHAPTLRGGTSGKRDRSPATALICASQST